MYPYYDQFRTLIERLAATPRVRLLRQDFIYPKPDTSLEYLEETARFLENEYGFLLPEEDWQLYSMTSNMDIMWLTRPDAVIPPGSKQLSGCISLLSIDDSLYSEKYHLYEMDPNNPDFAHCSYFETTGAENSGHPTFLHFVPGQGKAPDVRLFDRPDVLPLTTSIGEYVRAALAWHGAYGWQFLYLPLDVFKALPLVTRQKAYTLAKVLPDLFPDADWSVIDTKRAYFETEHA